MDDVVIWSNVVLVLAVIPWLTYLMVILFYSLSILYGSVSLPVCLSVCLSVSVCVMEVTDKVVDVDKVVLSILFDMSSM